MLIMSRFSHGAAQILVKKLISNDRLRTVYIHILEEKESSKIRNSFINQELFYFVS